jgi:membrane protease YdiL (CAAX protease family)
MKSIAEVIPSSQNLLRKFFVREDSVYDHYSSQYQAKSNRLKIIYLVLYMLPGLLAFCLINIRPVFFAQVYWTGLTPKYLQYAWLLIITFGWHILSPFLILRGADKLTLRQSCAFLGLNRIDWRGLLLFLPVYCVLFALVSLPYMRYLWNPLFHWLSAVPLFHVPAYSIFNMDTSGPPPIYSFPPIALLFLFIGNFLGEELYFRGYLMKKTAFLGRWNWIINSLLFALYHLWQIPQTWPAVGLILFFGLLMQLRKDIYTLVLFHLFVNMWLTYGLH